MKKSKNQKIQKSKIKILKIEKSKNWFFLFREFYLFSFATLIAITGLCGLTIGLACPAGLHGLLVGLKPKIGFGFLPWDWLCWPFNSDQNCRLSCFWFALNCRIWAHFWLRLRFCWRKFWRNSRYCSLWRRKKFLHWRFLAGFPWL